MQNSKLLKIISCASLLFISGCYTTPQLDNTKLDIYTIESESITNDAPNTKHLLEIERDFQGPQKDIELYRLYIDGQYIGNYDIENVTRDEEDTQNFTADLLLRNENDFAFSKVGNIRLRITSYGKSISGGKLRFKNTSYSLLHPAE